MPTSLQAHLDSIFNRGGELAPVNGAPARARLTRDDETAAIEDVKNGGSDGLVSLLYDYAPALRGTVVPYRAALGAEEAQAIAVATLVEVCHAVTPGSFLAGVLVEYLRDALSTAAGSTMGISVPSRTMKRVIGLLRKAEGDLALAAVLAPSYELTKETFYAAVTAMGVDSLEGQAETHGASDRARPVWESDDTAAEDRILAEAALRSVDPIQRSVCRHAYGFESYGDPLSDEAVGEALGLGRSKVQRTRSAALTKMRETLCVTLPAS